MAIESPPLHPKATPARETSPTAASSPAQRLLDHLLTSFLIRPKDWESLPGTLREALRSHTEREKLLALLVEHKLLTEYQADRISAGKQFGLILGNYRVLGRLGAGGMGVVFKAEHLRLPRLVAIKVLPIFRDHDPELLQRFFAEMWTVAELQHPNIAGAVDAGETAGSDPDSPTLYYFAMEYVHGQDLERYIEKNGPLRPAEACDLVYQIA